MSPLAVVVSIVLVDLLGFTIVMPLLPLFGERYGLSGWRIGLLYSMYPLCQLVAGPVLGRLSDRYGRRPVLVASQAGTALSFVLLGLASDFPTMLLARALDGASGGNILVAQAYVADVTAPENRSRSLGLLGMAFGVGFVLGPLLGGLLLGLPIDPEWQLRVPFFVAAGFSTLALILVLTRLPESLPEDASARRAARVLSWEGVVETLSRPVITRLVGLGFLATFSFAALEGTFSLFLQKRMHWGPSWASYGFAFLGFVSAMVQGGLIRRLVPRFGEARLIVAGLATLAAGMAMMALTSTLPALLAATLVVAVGGGLVSPSLSGLLSRLTPSGEQGAVFGTLSSAQTTARLLSYLAANVLFARVGMSSPFWAASLVATGALGLGMVVMRHARRDLFAVEAVASQG